MGLLWGRGGACCRAELQAKGSCPAPTYLCLALLGPAAAVATAGASYSWARDGDEGAGTGLQPMAL